MQSLQKAWMSILSLLHSLSVATKPRAWTNKIPPAGRARLEHVADIPSVSSTGEAVNQLFDQGFTTFSIHETRTEKLQGLDQREFRARVAAYDFGHSLKKELEEKRQLACIFRATKKRIKTEYGSFGVHTDGFYVSFKDSLPSLDCSLASFVGVVQYITWAISFFSFWGTLSDSLLFDVSKLIMTNEMKILGR
jgi:hypothetical protein